MEGKPEEERFKEIEHWEKRYVGHLLFCIRNHLFSTAPGGDEELRKALKQRERDEGSMLNVPDFCFLCPSPHLLSHCRPGCRSRMLLSACYCLDQISLHICMYICVHKYIAHYSVHACAPPLTVILRLVKIDESLSGDKVYICLKQKAATQRYI